MMTSATETFIKKQETKVFCWTIDEFMCSDFSAGVNLPADVITIPLDDGTVYKAHLTIQGGSDGNRKLLFGLKGPKNKSWQLNFRLESNIDLEASGYFSNDIMFHNFELITKTADLTIIKPLTFTISIYHSTYKSSSEPQFPITLSNYNQQLSELWKTKKFSDITFKLGDKEIRAHKNILASRSSVFADMFVDPMNDYISNMVVIEDIDPVVFEEMLSFIYTDGVKDLKTLAAKLLLASNIYDLPTLKSKCEEQLANDLSIENAAESLILADLHNAQELKKWAVVFLKENKSCAAKTQGWKKLLKDHTELVDDLLIELFKPLTTK